MFNDVTGVFNGILTGVVVGSVGSYLAPASAAAAGGALNVMGACALGGAVTFFGGSYLTHETGKQAKKSWDEGNYTLSAVLCALTAAEIGGLAFLASGIGASMLNLAVHPVFVCALLGTSPMIVPVLIAAAFAGIAGLTSLACHLGETCSM